MIVLLTAEREKLIRHGGNWLRWWPVIAQGRD
jgi:hypothetical protein